MYVFRESSQIEEVTKSTTEFWCRNVLENIHSKRL